MRITHTIGVWRYPMWPQERQMEIRPLGSKEPTVIEEVPDTAGILWLSGSPYGGPDVETRDNVLAYCLHLVRDRGWRAA